MLMDTYGSLTIGFKKSIPKPVYLTGIRPTVPVLCGPEEWPLIRFNLSPRA